MFFDYFSKLCNKKGVSCYKVCTDIGLNRSAVAKWKNGATPNGSTISAIADYFGVTTDYLLTGEEKENASIQNQDISDSDIKFALFNGDKEITDEQFEEVKRFAEYVRDRDKNKREPL